MTNSRVTYECTHQWCTQVTPLMIPFMTESLILVEIPLDVYDHGYTLSTISFDKIHFNAVNALPFEHVVLGDNENLYRKNFFMIKLSLPRE